MSARPVAWAVTLGGNFTDNIFAFEHDAQKSKVKLDSRYPEEVRAIVPLVPLGEDLQKWMQRAIEAERRVAMYDTLINTPEVDDFIQGVRLEAAYQAERWGRAHDRSKSAENWFWLVGYLAGKALRAAIGGDKTKAKHHTIGSAAALLNWHTAIVRDESGAGIGSDEDLGSLAK